MKIFVFGKRGNGKIKVFRLMLLFGLLGLLAKFFYIMLAVAGVALLIFVIKKIARRKYGVR